MRRSEGSVWTKERANNAFSFASDAGRRSPRERSRTASDDNTVGGVRHTCLVSEIELWWFDSEGVNRCTVAELPALHRRADGFCWVDIPSWSDAVEQLLSEEFGFHPMAVRACRERNHVPRIHVYSDHLFVVVHAPEIGERGHVHYLELDQFIGQRFLVSVHGPLNPAVDPAAARREVDSVIERVESGRLRPASPFALAYAIVSTMVRNEAAQIAELAEQVGRLEQRVMAAVNTAPEDFLNELFTARHELLTIRTMASQGGEIFQRAVELVEFAPPEELRFLHDLRSQYERVERISHSQLEFLMGVTEFYRARTDTKMTIAAERLAVIAAVTLPVTAISSVMGMNVIVNDSTHWAWLILLLAVMGTMCGILLHWTKRLGWW